MGVGPNRLDLCAIPCLPPFVSFFLGRVAWAIHEAQCSVARSMGFSPIKTQTNKAGDVLTTRFELVPMSHEEHRKAVLESLTDAELTALLEARTKADATDKAKGEANAAKLTGEAPATEVKSEVVSQS